MEEECQKAFEDPACSLHAVFDSHLIATLQHALPPLYIVPHYRNRFVQ